MIDLRFILVQNEDIPQILIGRDGHFDYPKHTIYLNLYENTGSELKSIQVSIGLICSFVKPGVTNTTYFLSLFEQRYVINISNNGLYQLIICRAIHYRIYNKFIDLDVYILTNNF